MTRRTRGRILFDATELLANPIRTGIQRVVRSLLQHWPDPAALVLCRFDALHGLVTVPPQVRALLCDAQQTMGPAEMGAAIAARLAGERRAAPDLPILVPELFFDVPRCAQYRRRLEADPDSVSFIAYDFIPWLHPESIGVCGTAPQMPYLQLLRDARRVGFISRATRTEFARAITHRPEAGPVFALGADGPGLARQSWSAARDVFLAVGSVDGRKNQDVVLDAFELLWAAGVPARLVLVGRVFGHMDRLATRIAGLQRTQTLFEHHADITDGALAALYARARATIYASTLEGYGLPPVESLQCGVPAIVYGGLPSVVDLPGAGLIRLAAVTPAAIADAVRPLVRGGAASRLWRAVPARMPTWSAMSEEVAAWMRGV